MLKALSVAAASLLLSAVAIAQEPPPPGWFARVNGNEISAATFDKEAKEAFRTKFFHGTPPEAEVNYMLRQVGESLIDQILLNREVDIRKIAPDQKAVQAQIDALEQRYGDSPAWKQQREQTLPNLRAHFERKSRLDTLEKQIREVDASPDEVRAYYDKNPKLFTEPEKNRVSLILFRVDPSSPVAEWEKSLKRAEDTKAEILAGADFAKLAISRSDDHSAENGGDLGYLHQGMLSPVIEAEIAKAKLGETYGPVRSLEGYVIYRLDGRVPSSLREFSAVSSRAKDLWLREKAATTWLEFLDALRKGQNIEISPAFEAIMRAPNPNATKK